MQLRKKLIGPSRLSLTKMINKLPKLVDYCLLVVCCAFGVNISIRPHLGNKIAKSPIDFSAMCHKLRKPAVCTHQSLRKTFLSSVRTSAPCLNHLPERFHYLPCFI